MAGYADRSGHGVSRKGKLGGGDTATRLEADLTDYIVGACILNKHCQFTSLAAVFGQRFRNIGKAGICYGILCVLGKELSLLLGNIS